MELLGEDAINSIAEMCGVTLNRPRVVEEKDEKEMDEQAGDIAPSAACDDTKYIIRRGKEEDVLRDVSKRLCVSSTDNGVSLKFRFKILINLYSSLKFKSILYSETSLMMGVVMT